MSVMSHPLAEKKGGGGHTNCIRQYMSTVKVKSCLIITLKDLFKICQFN